MELSGPKIRKFLYFLNILYFYILCFLIFREVELLKKTSYISGENFLSSEKVSFILGNGTFKTKFEKIKKNPPPPSPRFPLPSPLVPPQKKVIYFRRKGSKNKKFKSF